MFELTPEYRSWQAMKRRCYNKNVHSYPHYGGRGITVCERWRTSFAVFLSDVGVRPFVGAELGRINNNGNYEPGNVRWESRKQQTRNTRRSKFITFQGETRTVTEWAERAGMPIARLQARLGRLGMPFAIAIQPERRSVRGLAKGASSWKANQAEVWGLQ